MHPNLMDLEAQDYQAHRPEEFMLRVLYLQNGSKMDLVAAKHEVDVYMQDYVDAANDDDLEWLIRDFEFGNQHRRWLDGGRRWTAVTQDRYALLALLTLDLHERLDAVAESLDVYGTNPDPGVTTRVLGNLRAYYTGGLSDGFTDPTTAYTAWEVVTPNGLLLPEEWSRGLANAAGFLTPEGSGDPPVFTVPFFEMQ